MNAKQARENLLPYGLGNKVNFSAKSEIELVEKCSKWAMAKGYLEALEGPEVKVLVEALEYYEMRDNGQFVCFPKDVVIPKAHLALAQYREALGK